MKLAFSAQVMTVACAKCAATDGRSIKAQMQHAQKQHAQIQHAQRLTTTQHHQSLLHQPDSTTSSATTLDTTSGHRHHRNTTMLHECVTTTRNARHVTSGAREQLLSHAACAPGVVSWLVYAHERAVFLNNTGTNVTAIAHPFMYFCLLNHIHTSTSQRLLPV